MTKSPEDFTIGQLASAAAVNVETIRFYQRKGLLPEPDRPYGSIRRYRTTDLARLSFIKSAQRLGFTLDEIAQLLVLDDGTHCAAARAIGERKLAAVKLRIADLKRMESALAALLKRCATNRGKVRCPLTESLHQHNRRT